MCAQTVGIYGVRGDSLRKPYPFAEFCSTVVFAHNYPSVAEFVL